MKKMKKETDTDTDTEKRKTLALDAKMKIAEIKKRLAELKEMRAEGKRDLKLLKQNLDRRPYGKVDIRSVAVHESGHAVIHRILGLPCGPAHITAGCKPSGVSSHYVPLNPDKKRQHIVARKTISGLLAGREAEIILLGTDTAGFTGDLEIIGLYLRQAKPPKDEDVEHWLFKLRMHTRRLVRKYRVAIDAVARALAKHERLSGERIYEIVFNSTPRQDRGRLWDRYGRDWSGCLVKRDRSGFPIRSRRPF
jgi:hypothetical protein